MARKAPASAGSADFTKADAFVWHAEGSRLVPVPKVNRVEMSLLKGIDRMRDILVENTERFARAIRERIGQLQRAVGPGVSSAGAASL